MVTSGILAAVRSWFQVRRGSAIGRVPFWLGKTKEPDVNGGAKVYQVAASGDDDALLLG